MRPLRPHQESALQLIRQNMRAKIRKFIVQAPTGFGKTVLMSHIVDGALTKQNIVFICVPSISLIDQTVQSLAADGITRVGVIQATHEMTDPTQPVQVCSLASLKNRNLNGIIAIIEKATGWEKPKTIILVDEAHENNDFLFDLMDTWNAVPFIGLTATPWTKGLGQHYDDLIVASTTQTLIDDGFLSPFRVFAPAHPDLAGVGNNSKGDYKTKELSEAMQRGTLVADIVTTWKKHGEGRPTLVFAVDRAHAKMIQVQFEEAGHPCGYVDAHVDRPERQAIADKFHAGEFQLVSSVGCLTTGVDWDVRCIILARPTKSEILFTQIIGRGLRTAEGKEDCLILDHSDTHLRLGFVTDINHDELDDGKTSVSAQRLKEEPLPKECPSCHFLKKPKQSLCPACGYLPERQCDIETDGTQELQELKGKMSSKEKTNKNTAPEEKVAFYGGLRMYAKEKGYKEGWAANQYREKFGVWPNKYRDSPAVTPNKTVLNWIAHQRIKYAKGKAA